MSDVMHLNGLHLNGFQPYKNDIARKQSIRPEDRSYHCLPIIGVAKAHPNHVTSPHELSITKL